MQEPAEASSCGKWMRNNGHAGRQSYSGGYALDIGIGKNIRFIAALRRELGDNRSLSPGLEPVQNIRHQGILIAWVQYHFMPNRIGGFASCRRLGGRLLGLGTRHI